MVNVPVLESYMKKKAYTWEGLNKDVGGLPPTIEDFAATFEDSATADQITAISNYLQIPSYAIGSVFFAPANYDKEEKPHLAPLEDMGDVIVDLYRQFTLRERHRIFDTALTIFEQNYAEEETS